ncbi:hypothetical protein L1987_26791 [Smallanthus sonchifolius]|uniref:Uncharacterized protein n=1 Tax=Smallanthus sonchifolius TaxID=185202 RepID=A0ACB9IBR2_9ASTR|nr:hypothetical protein L1987_26791 [Smallanthus sonchifolius]
MRKMKKLPKTRCWRVGSCNVDVEDAINKVGGVPHRREACVGSSEEKSKGRQEQVVHSPWYEFSGSTIDDMKSMGRKAYIL